MFPECMILHQEDRTVDIDNISWTYDC